MTNVKGVADLKAIPVPLPPAQDQGRIILDIERRSSLFDEVDKQVTSNLQRAEHMRQSILKQAFSGRMVTDTSQLKLRA